MRRLDDRIRREEGSCILAQDSSDPNVFYLGTIDAKAWVGSSATTREEDRKPNASVHLHQAEPVWSIKRTEAVGGVCSCTEHIVSFVKNPNTNERSWTAVWDNREALEYR